MNALAAEKPGRGVVLAMVALAAAGVGLLLFATGRYGPGVYHDTVSYFACAESLAGGGGFVLFDGSPMRVFPPLYPIMITVGLLLGASATATVLAINAAAYGLTVFLAALWVFRWSRSAWALATGLAVVVSPHVLDVYSAGLSDAVFDLLVVLFLWHMSAFVSRQTLGCLLLAALWACLACLQRYVGVVLLVAAGGVLLAHRGIRWRRKALWGLAFLAVSAVPTAAWLVWSSWRKLQATGTVMPVKTGPPLSVFDAMNWAGGHLLHWAFPLAEVLVSGAIPFLVLVCLLVGGPIIMGVWRHVICRRDPSLSPAFPVLVFVALYLAGIVRTKMELRYARETGDRYLSPLYVPMVMLIWYAAARLLSWMSQATWPKRTLRRLLLSAGGLVLLAWLGSSSVVTAKTVAAYVRHGAGGYNQDRVKLSATLVLANSTPLPGPMISNQPELMFYLGTRKPPLWVRKTILGPNGQPMSPQWMIELGFDGPGAPGVLVWFNAETRPDACSFEEVQRLFEMKTVAVLADGSIYEVRPRGTPLPATASAPTTAPG